MYESKGQFRIQVIHYLARSRVSSSYVEQIGCISRVDTRICSVRRTHVRRLLITIRKSCFQYNKTVRQTSKTKNLIWCKLCLNTYSEHISCLSNANTRISSLAMSNVSRLRQL